MICSNLNRVSDLLDCDQKNGMMDNLFLLTFPELGLATSLIPILC